MTDLITRTEAQALVDEAVAAARDDMRTALRDFAALSIENHHQTDERIELLRSQLLQFMGAATGACETMQTTSIRKTKHQGIRH